MENNLAKKYSERRTFVTKNSINEMRKENRINREKEALLLQIEKNPELINNWGVEKLLKLEKVFDDKIKNDDEEIAKLKKKLYNYLKN